jgi:hypothetical protein
MLLKGNPSFQVKHISSLWESKIPSLKALKGFIPGSLLVAIDVQFPSQGTSEIGVAFLPVNTEQSLQLPGDGTLRTLYHQNAIQTHTIEIYDRMLKRHPGEGVKYGSSISVDAENVTATIVKLISATKHAGSLLLVGFDMYAEFKWMS